MKHWQYTDVPNTCQSCGFKTCSLPTFRRHVKHCSSPPPPLAQTKPDNDEDKDAQTKVSPTTSSSSRIRKCRRCKFSSSDNSEFMLHQRHAHADGIPLLSCDKCDFICILVNDLKSHKDTAHAKVSATKTKPAMEKHTGMKKTAMNSSVEENMCTSVLTGVEMNVQPHGLKDGSGVDAEDAKKPGETRQKTGLHRSEADVTTAKKNSSPSKKSPKKTGTQMHRKEVKKSSHKKKTPPKPRIVNVNGNICFGCRKCSFSSIDFDVTRRHIKACCNPPKKFSCPTCGVSFDMKVAFVKHKLTHADADSSYKNIYNCSECSYKTPLRKNYERHRVCHSSDATYRCTFCSYSSTGESAVRRHTSTYHNKDDELMETPKGALSRPSSSQVRKSDSSSQLEISTTGGSGSENSSDEDDEGNESSTQSPQRRIETFDHPRHAGTLKELRECSGTVVLSAAKETQNEQDKSDTTLDNPSDEGVEEKSVIEDIESQDEEDSCKMEGEDVDIVWTCFYCKLDFKQRTEMEQHTRSEHSIQLEDCVLYSLDTDTTAESLFDMEEEQLPDVLSTTVSETDVKLLQCAFCEFTARCTNDLKRHSERKHESSKKSLDPAKKKGQKRFLEHSSKNSEGEVKSKKMKCFETKSENNSTILAKLLQNDDPQTVYRPSESCSQSGGENNRYLVTKQKPTLDKAGAKFKKSLSFVESTEQDQSYAADASDEVIADDDDDYDDDSSINVSTDDVMKNSLKCNKLLNFSNSEKGDDKEVDYLMSLMCNFCGYLGSNPSEVERHRKIHTGEKNYWCPCCDYKTIWKCDVKKHLLKFHSGEITTPESLTQLLFRAYRPDGEHTAEELGFQISKKKGRSVEKKEMEIQKKQLSKAKHGNLLHIGKTPIKSDKDVPFKISSSKKLLQKAKKKLLGQKVTPLVEQNLSGQRQVFLREETYPGKKPENNLGSNNASGQSSVPASGIVVPERCRPYKCSACGRRSNWKWDLKKHISERHPSATIIKLSDEDARKTYSEIVKVQTKKQLLAGYSRIRLDSEQGATKEEKALKVDRQLKPFHVVKKFSNSYLGKKTILKGMVDLQKLKRFKCCGCLYRSNFRGDISRHIVKRHPENSGSVIVLSAEAAASSLSSYESRWKLRKVLPIVDNEDANAADMLTTQADRESNRTSPDLKADDVGINGKVIYRNRSMENSGGNRIATTGTKSKSSNDSENAESIKRRMRTQAEGDELKCCNVCPYVTEKSDLLKLHMSYHQPQARNGYSCTYCPYFVNTARLLHHHLLLHVPKESVALLATEIRPTPKFKSAIMESKYICDKCPFISNFRHDYWEHRRNHFEKPTLTFKCDVCMYWAPDKRALSLHAKLHAKTYFPINFTRVASHNRTKDMDNLPCRCVLAEKQNDLRFQCGSSILCPYCSYTTASVLLMRQHIVFHVSFTDAAKGTFFHKSLDDADDRLTVPCIKTRRAEQKEDISAGMENILQEAVPANEEMKTVQIVEIVSCENMIPSNGMTLGKMIPLLGSTEVTYECSLESSCLSDETLCPNKVVSENTDMPAEGSFPEMEFSSCETFDESDVLPGVAETIIDNKGTASPPQLEETVSVVELSAYDTSRPGETLSVVELPLTEFLCLGERLSAEDAMSEASFGSETMPVLELAVDIRRFSEMATSETSSMEDLQLEDSKPVLSPLSEAVSIVELPSLDDMKALEMPLVMCATPEDDNERSSLISETVSIVDVPLNENSLSNVCETPGSLSTRHSLSDAKEEEEVDKVESISKVLLDTNDTTPADEMDSSKELPQDEETFKYTENESSGTATDKPSSTGVPFPENVSLGSSNSEEICNGAHELSPAAEECKKESDRTVNIATERISDLASLEAVLVAKEAPMDEGLPDVESLETMADGRDDDAEVSVYLDFETYFMRSLGLTAFQSLHS